jgi:MFS family permease
MVRLGGVYVLVVGFYAAAAACALLLRPDPRTLAADREQQTAADNGGSALLLILRVPHARLALGAMVVAQATMVLVMTMTPVHMGDAGHGLGSIGAVMSAHFLGMFGLAPVAGKLSDRVGGVAVIVMGLALELAATIASASVPASVELGLGASLFALGLGWSFTFVAGSSLLTHGMRYEQRVRVQGGADATLWTFSAVASVGSGILIQAIGYSALSLAGALVVAPTLLLIARNRQAATPSAETP